MAVTGICKDPEYSKKLFGESHIIYKSVLVIDKDKIEHVASDRNRICRSDQTPANQVLFKCIHESCKYKEVFILNHQRPIAKS